LYSNKLYAASAAQHAAAAKRKEDSQKLLDITAGMNVGVGLPICCGISNSSASFLLTLVACGM
jgi:hypothetical protein